MQLNIQEAIKIVQNSLPNGKIESAIEYKNLYLFQVFSYLPGEEEMDPFFSVNKETGEFSDFSIITDGDTEEIISLFEKEKRKI